MQVRFETFPVGIGFVQGRHAGELAIGGVIVLAAIGDMSIDIQCLDPTIAILRKDSSDNVIENHTHTGAGALNFRLARNGGCLDAWFTSIRERGDTGSMAYGDTIEIEFGGSTVWKGFVNSFIYENGLMEVRCLGAWTLLQSIKPINRVYGTEADYEESDDEDS